MTVTSADMIRAGIVEQACAWQARLLSGEVSAEEKQRFLRWLRENPANVREYLQQTRIAKLMPRALEYLPAQPDDSAAIDKIVHLPSSFRHRSPTRRTLRWAAAILIVCGGSLAGLVQLHRDSMNLSAERGEQRSVRLDDGSVIRLNSQSMARVRYSSGDRTVELVRGQALFTVARDATRPFRVRAGGTEVVAVGTAFDIYRRADADVTVTVIEGKVDILDRDTAAAPRRVGVGEQIRLGSAAVKPAVAPVDLHSALAWTRREMVFSGRPLGEVAQEFNRYLGVPVRIEDPQLAATRVSGNFSTVDESGFVAFLREFAGAEVSMEADSIRVRARR